MRPAANLPILLLALATLACSSPPSKDEEPEWLRKRQPQIEADGAVEIPEDAAALGGDFHLVRESFSLAGEATLTLWSDGRVEGTRNGDPAEARLSDAEIAMLRRLAGALLALPRDEYINHEIRDGLRVRYTLHRAAAAPRTITCANELPPGARGLEQLVHRHVPSNW